MKNCMIGLISILFVISNGCSNGQSRNNKNSLQTTDFSEKINAMPASPVIDVRTPAEYAQGHLMNAKNFDWNGNDFEQQISTLDKTKPVFVYCQSGGRSEAAAKKMRSEGFHEVYELSGGFSKWRTAKLPETNN